LKSPKSTSPVVLKTGENESDVNSTGFFEEEEVELEPNVALKEKESFTKLWFAEEAFSCKEAGGFIDPNIASEVKEGVSLACFNVALANAFSIKDASSFLLGVPTKLTLPEEEVGGGGGLDLPVAGVVVE
jgi:hypothetical protein